MEVSGDSVCLAPHLHCPATEPGSEEHTLPPVRSPARLSVSLESEAPDPLPPGKAMAVFLYGSCGHATREIRRLELIVDGAAQPVLAHGMPRPETPAPRGGFWTVATIPARERARDVPLDLRVSFADGGRETATLTRIEIEDAEPRTRPQTRPARRPAVAICMGTFDPDPELFRSQIDSLRAQTEPGWICLISDDCSRP